MSATLRSAIGPSAGEQRLGRSGSAPGSIPDILKLLPGAVSVTTARGPKGEDHGITVGTVVPLSNDPPLVLMCIARRTRMHRILSAAEHFGVSVLPEHGIPIAQLFASRVDDRFAGVECCRGVTGVMLLRDAVAHLECLIVARHDEGDHTIVVGEVLVCNTSEGYPLLYMAGRYGRLDLDCARGGQESARLSTLSRATADSTLASRSPGNLVHRQRAWRQSMQTTDFRPLIDVAFLEQRSCSLRAESNGQGTERRPDASELERRLQQRLAWETVLVHQTVEFAKQTVPYYAELFAGSPELPQRIERLSDLRKLPILRRATLAENAAALVSSATEAATIRCTSGTSGQRLAIYGSADESNAYNALKRWRNGGDSNRNGDIILRVVPPMRRIFGGGRRSSLIPQLMVLFDPVSRDVIYDWDDLLMQALTDEYPIPGTGRRITRLHVTPPLLFEEMTKQLQFRGFDFRRSSVRRVDLTGSQVTPLQRALVKDVWGAELRTTYSCAEVRGVAIECRESPGVFHFDETVYAEVIDPETGEPCRPGEAGELLLTSLYPFQQAMPLIRYEVGDMVQVGERPCRCAALGKTIRVLGRKSHCVDWRTVSGRREYLGSLEVEAALCTIPEVPHVLYPRFEWSLRTLEPGQHELRIDLEVYNWALGQPGLKARIAAALTDYIEPLGRDVAAGKVRLTVEIRPRGSLQNALRLLRAR